MSRAAFLELSSFAFTKRNVDKASAIARDFRTDTITMPVDAMFDVMKTTSRGDSIYDEDEATLALQDRLAKMAGKEAGLFCVSGTMSNQLALRTHLHQPPHSVLTDHRSHVHTAEAGGIAFHSQATTIPVAPANGHHLTLEDIERNIIRGDDVHSAPTRVVSLENTLAGQLYPQDELERISAAMRAEGVIMHCDGARMMEAAAATGTSLETLCQPFDSVSICLSKGLGAPIGSMLVGSRDVIKKATWLKKLFGGGIRQSGMLAASADYALTNHFSLLLHSHMLARRLAQKLAALGVRLTTPTETNITWIDPEPLGFTLKALCTRLKEDQGITLRNGRIITHIQTDPAAVDDFASVVAKMKEEYADKAEVITPEEHDRNMRFANGEWKPMDFIELDKYTRISIYEAAKR